MTPQQKARLEAAGHRFGAWWEFLGVPEERTRKLEAKWKERNAETERNSESAEEAGEDKAPR